MQLKKFYHLLPLLILITAALLKIGIQLGVEQPAYIYDEMIVTEISKQPLDKLLETIKAEPHPPGYYFLIKIFPLENVTHSRVYNIVLSSLLVLIALWYVYHKEIVQKYDLTHGLAIFISISVFAVTTFYLKQDAVTLPLLLLFFFALLAYSQNKKSTDLIIMSLLLPLLLFFGYRSYLLALALYVLTVVVKPGKKIPSLLIGLQIVVLMIYSRILLIEQLVLNTGRFAWRSENYNSIIKVLSESLIGAENVNYFTDIPLLLFTSFVAVGLFELFKKTNSRMDQIDRIKFYFVIATVVFIPVFYLSGSFLRPRYAYPFIFLITLISGWGVSYLTNRFEKAFLVVFIFIFFSLSSFASVVSDQTFRILEDRLSITANNNNFGYIEDRNPISPFVIKEYSDRLEKVIPVHALYPDLSDSEEYITKEILSKEGDRVDISTEEISDNLKLLGIDNYFYAVDELKSDTYYDPEKRVLNALVNNCELKEVYKVNNIKSLYRFEGCRFDN